MPYYEITVTVSKEVCVKADCESEAKDKACDELMSDWNQIEAEVEDEFDENDPKEMEFVKEYKEHGEYYEA